MEAWGPELHPQHWHKTFKEVALVYAFKPRKTDTGEWLRLPFQAASLTKSVSPKTHWETLSQKIKWTVPEEWHLRLISILHACTPLSTQTHRTYGCFPRNVILENINRNCNNLTCFLNSYHSHLIVNHVINLFS